MNNDTLSLLVIKIKPLKVTKSNKNNGLITQDWLKFTMSSLAQYLYITQGKNKNRPANTIINHK